MESPGHNVVPYLLHVKENGASKFSTLYLTKNDLENLGHDKGTILLEPTTTHAAGQNRTVPTVNYICEVIGPRELDLLPMLPKSKRARLKKLDDEKEPIEIKSKIEPLQRTRSGRAVKFPKYIVKDFKKIEINDKQLRPDDELKVTDFLIPKEPPVIKPDAKHDDMGIHQKKRKIAAQYRCPKCQKAYLGRTKMLDHLKKNPSHGPAPNRDLNFEVWNYLVCLTQKCSPAQRGTKLCEELTNLLHNLLLLNNALFKTDQSVSKNKVSVDKVLGNAIGLPPGSYYFDDSKLHKDVTVLKLLDNEYLFKDAFSTTRDNDKTGTLSENLRNISSDHEPADRPVSENFGNISSVHEPADSTKELEQNTSIVCDNSNNDFCGKKSTSSDVCVYYPQMFNMENLDHTGFDITMSESPPKPIKNKSSTQNSTYKTNEESAYCSNSIKLSFESNNDAMDSFDSHTIKKVTFETNTIIDRYDQSNTSAASFGDTNSLKNVESAQKTNNQRPVAHSSLLSDHSLLGSLPHLRSSVDEELILADATNLLENSATNLLDNSSSSDEVMNVDQFVNERFKTITEADLELNNTSLNLELPSLDMFEFHTS